MLKQPMENLTKKEILFVWFATLIHSQNNRQIDTSYSDWSEEKDGFDYFKYKLDSLGIKYSFNSSNWILQIDKIKSRFTDEFSFEDKFNWADLTSWGSGKRILLIPRNLNIYHCQIF